MTLIYVGDNIVDLAEGSKITISVQKIKIADLKSRFINYSNSVKATNSENNAVIFGGIINEKSLSTKPYRILSCRVIQNGIEIISDGRLIISGVDSDGYEISVYENVIDFFNEITGKTLSDINPITNTGWLATDIDTLRTATSGVVSAIFSWGKPGAIYQYDYFLPSFYYHSLVTYVLEYTGLTLSGDILTDSRFKELIVPFFNGEFLYPESLIATVPARSDVGGPQSFLIRAATSPQRVSLQFLRYGTKFNTTTNAYEYDIPNFDVSVTVDATVTIDNVVFGSGSQITAKLLKNGVTVLDSYNYLGSPDTAVLSWSGELTNGDYLSLEMYSDAPGVADSLDVTDGELIVSASRVVSRTSVNWNRFLSGLTCDDLLKDFFNRFGIIHKQTNNTLFLKTIDEIIKDRAGAVDWSYKLVSEINPISFTTTWAQSNYFNYKDAVSDPFLGRGELTIDNQTIKLTSDVFNSVFENCTTEEIDTQMLALIPIYNADSTSIGVFDEGDPGLKLLTVRTNTTGSPITFNAIARSDYKVGYFIDNSQTKDTGFQYFVDQFYTSLESALQFNKVITKYYYLNELDIKNYDPHKMVYDGDGYYLVNRISNFIPGKITKVELFKVS